ncbi:MAG: crossover junction endodeoxyribonuclease RuvC [bacterium JZ-2024 1]
MKLRSQSTSSFSRSKATARFTTRFAAIDPSVNSTGLAIFSGPVLIDSFVLKQKGTTEEKLLSLFVKVGEIIDKYSVARIVIEIPDAVLWRRNIKSLFVLNQAIGVIAGSAASRAIPFTFIPVHRWKKNRPKSADLLAAKSKYGITSHDASDAIGLGEYWWRLGRHLDLAAHKTSSSSPG